MKKAALGITALIVAVAGLICFDWSNTWLAGFLLWMGGFFSSEIVRAIVRPSAKEKRAA